MKRRLILSKWGQRQRLPLPGRPGNKACELRPHSSHPRTGLAPARPEALLSATQALHLPHLSHLGSQVRLRWSVTNRREGRPPPAGPRDGGRGNKAVWPSSQVQRKGRHGARGSVTDRRHHRRIAGSQPRLRLTTGPPSTSSPQSFKKKTTLPGARGLRWSRHSASSPVLTKKPTRQRQSTKRRARTAPGAPAPAPGLGSCPGFAGAGASPRAEPRSRRRPSSMRTRAGAPRPAVAARRSRRPSPAPRGRGPRAPAQREGRGRGGAERGAVRPGGRVRPRRLEDARLMGGA